MPAFWDAGRLADRLPALPLLLAILLSFCVYLVALTLAVSPTAVLASSLLVGFVVHVAFPVTDTHVLSTLPDDHRRSGYAIYSGLFMAISTGGPWAVGMLTEAGARYGRVFQGFAVGLATALVAFSALHAAGRTPGSPAR